MKTLKGYVRLFAAMIIVVAAGLLVFVWNDEPVFVFAVLGVMAVTMAEGAWRGYRWFVRQHERR